MYVFNVCMYLVVIDSLPYRGRKRDNALPNSGIVGGPGTFSRNLDILLSRFVK